ncbi:MAG: pectinesterase family protein, partial [candidate division WOR-3 bacterium]
ARCLSVLIPALILAGACAKRPLLYEGRPPDILVAKDGSGDFTTISAAVRNATEGAVIGVKPGRYVEKVEITDVSGITLFGAGPGRSIIDAGGEYAAVSLASDDVTISGFTLTGGGSHGVYVKDGHHTIERCLITGNRDRGIYLSNTFGDGSADISYCTIVDNEVSGIYSIADNPMTEITYCIIARNGRGIVTDGEGEGMTVEYNVLDNRDANFERVSDESDNVIADPKFVNPARGDFRLRPDSPARNIDGDGNNAGCF